MKRIILLLLALLLLAACGQIAPEQPTTKAAATIEETTTGAPFVPTEDENNEISWRTLDVNSAEGREINAWLAEQHEERMQERPTEFPMGKDKIIRTSSNKIILRDNKTGKDTVLLEKQYMGEETTPEEMREEAWRYPRFAQALDERYFVHCWGYWEGSGQPAVYDTKTMRVVPIEYGDGDWYTSQQLIFADALYLLEGTYDPWAGPLRLMRVDLKALDKLKDNESLKAVDMLADIQNVKDANDANYCIVTLDERFFIMNDMDGLRVYDLAQKKLLLELPNSVFGPDMEDAVWWRSEVALRDNRAYWFDRQGGYAYLAEIKLP